MTIKRGGFTFHMIHHPGKLPAVADEKLSGVLGRASCHSVEVFISPCLLEFARLKFLEVMHTLKITYMPPYILMVSEWWHTLKTSYKLSTLYPSPNLSVHVQTHV